MQDHQKIELGFWWSVQREKGKEVHHDQRTVSLDQYHHLRFLLSTSICQEFARNNKLCNYAMIFDDEVLEKHAQTFQCHIILISLQTFLELLYSKYQRFLPFSFFPQECLGQLQRCFLGWTLDLRLWMTKELLCLKLQMYLCICRSLALELHCKSI